MIKNIHIVKLKFTIYAVIILIGVFELSYRVYKDFLISTCYKKARTIYLEKTRGGRRPLSSLAYDNPQEDYGDRYARIPEMEFDIYLGFIPKASSMGNGYKINQDHFRYSEDFPAEKEENEVRIFITGGSTAWGAGVNQEQLYTTLTETLLQNDFPNKKIRVISAGVGAYCSAQERILIENKLLNFSPDFIIMFSGYNDSYLAYRGDDVFKQGSDHFNYRKKIEKKDGKYKYYDSPRYEEYLLKVHYLIDSAFYKLRYSRKEKLLNDISSNMVNHEVATKNLLRNINIVNVLAKSFNYKFIFYLQPCIFNTNKVLDDYERHIIDLAQKRYIGFGDHSNKIYELYRKILPRDAKEKGYVFLDGDEAVSKEEKAVFVDFCHFGDRGNRLIANHLYNLLKDLLNE